MSVKELRKEFEASKNKFVAQIQEAFAEEVKAFFLRFPDVKKISWTQYTPYFNDGDTCEFSVNEWSVKAYGVQHADDYDEDDYDEDDSEAAQAFGKLLREAGDDVLKAAYGDHVKVTIKSNGKVETDDYEHD